MQPAEVIIVNDDADPKRLAGILNIVQIPTSDSTESNLAAASRDLLSDNETTL